MPSYNLEERTLEFAIRTRTFIKQLKSTNSNFLDGKQVIRSSGSIGANYIEVNENLGKKDFIHRLKIARKEAKETTYWLRIIQRVNKMEDNQILNTLIQESIELRRILSAILNKSQQS